MSDDQSQVPPPPPRAASGRMLAIELQADGGIRLTTPDGQSGLATLATMHDWIDRANRDQATVRLSGALNAPMSTSVAADVKQRAEQVEAGESQPTAWAKGHSSIQTAAANGLLAQLQDLVARGADVHTGRRPQTPYRLAMQHGWVDVLVALRDAGVAPPRGATPPASLPNAVVFRRFPPMAIWLVLVPIVIGAVAAAVAGIWFVAATFVAFAIAIVVFLNWVFSKTSVAIAGPQLARRSPGGWKGPIDLGHLDAIGYRPYGGIRLPAIWALGQRQAGDKPNVYSRADFTNDQLEQIAARGDVRFVTLDGFRGFLSPGIERHLAAHIDRNSVIAGGNAVSQIWG